MQTATVSSQGQIAIPKRIRQILGLRPGSRVAFIPGLYALSLVPQNGKWVKKAKGMLKNEIDMAGGVKKAHATFEEEWDKK
ncbi:AbrB/MazE/SpoVT family DNA-binding domain-containing protein [Candidatus Woesebacteria bacterium]|nr:AbrB/MazE/SpoVT family DNA-binding domain-containing protein [Candidatus Woesebacteria bacterium]